MDSPSAALFREEEMATKAERDEARHRRIVDSHPISQKSTFQKKDISKEKPLFGHASTSMERGPFGSSPKSGAHMGAVEGVTMPASRIPRKSSQSPDVASNSFRKSGAAGLKLTDAWNMAAREDQDAYGIGEKQGSPSPAPRARPPLRSRESDELRMAKIRAGYTRPATAPVQETLQESVDIDLTTSTSGSGGSRLGSVGSLPDITDSTLEKKMTQWERDLARKEKILGNKAPLFAKKDRGVHSSGLTRKSSGSSLEGEPVVINRRSEWGTRAPKFGTGWMRKIVSPENSGELVEVPKATAQDASVDWAGAAADTPLASVEDDTSIQEPTPPHSRPSSAQPITASPQKSQTSDAELDFSVDFTAKSVLYSNSPALHARGSKIDEIRQREIETLNKRAVATSRLEDIRERNSAERSASPEVTRSPAKDTPRRSTPSQGSSRRESEASSRVASAESSRRQSEVSLRRESTERTRTPDIKKAPGNEVQIEEKSRPLSGGSHGRSLSKDAITSALQSTNNLRLTPSPKVSLERLREPKTAEAPADSEASSTKQEAYHEKTILEEEGEHIPGTPITVFYGAAKDKPQHKRGGSWEALQKLSRILSSSPAGPSEEKESKGKETAKEDSSRLSNVVTLEVKRLSAASTPPKSDVDPEERIAAEASLFDLPENNRSERNSLRAPSPDNDSSSDGVDETPRPKPDPLSMPTPVVTGAYIDTPAPTVRQLRRPARASSPADDGDDARDDTARVASDIARRDFVRGQKGEPSQSRSSSTGPSRARSDRGPLSSHPVNQNSRGRSAGRFRPRLLNTANPASVADDLREIQQEAQIEDSTLDDFDELLAMEDDDSDPNSTTIMEPVVDLEKDERGRPLSEQERERRIEALTYERLNIGLKNGLLSIRDAKRGIERLEDRVSSSPDPAAQSIQSNKLGKASIASYEPNALVYIAIPIPRLWIWDSTKRWGMRLTWLGLIVGLIFSWITAETVTCEFICRPEYATTNNWRPGDPEWGMAVPTLIDRASGGFLTVARSLVGGILSWVWALWTDSDIKQESERAVNTGREAWNNWEGGSMFEDETI